MSPRAASRGATLAVLLVGAGLGFVAGAQPWWRASGQGAAVTQRVDHLLLQHLQQLAQQRGHAGLPAAAACAAGP